jgi:hypothetical protein
MIWTPQDVLDAKARMGGKGCQQGYAQGEGASKQSKYHNVLTECDGIRFQSKKEAKYYRELCCRVHAGEVRYFLRQVPFHLFGVVYRVDFMEVLKDGRIRYVDVKGFRNRAYINKRKQVMVIYPVVIEEA